MTDKMYLETGSQNKNKDPTRSASIVLCSLFIAVFSLSILLSFFGNLFVSRQTEDGAKAQKEDCLGCHTEDGSNAHAQKIAPFQPKCILKIL
jgi:cytochrome c553